MNIVVLENEPSSSRGGQERSLLDTCRGLASKGHTICLLYVREGNLLKDYRGFCSKIIQVKGYSVDNKQIPNSVLQFVADLFKLPGGSNTIFYSNQYHDSLFGSAASFLKSAPYVCHLRLPPPASFCSQWKIGLKGVKRFITISQKTQQDWVDCGFKLEKIDVVYNGIDTEVFKPREMLSPVREHWNIPQGSEVISYVGRLDREKGIETLIRAFPRVLDCFPNAYLMLAGKPLCHENEQAGQDYVSSLKTLARTLAVSDRIKFLGHLDETFLLYQSSDITVLPSIHSEPFGRSIIESMACGTPCVASHTGGIPELLTEEFRQCLFDPGDATELAISIEQNISLVKRDPDLPDRCRQHVLDRFSSTRMVDGIDKVLSEAVVGR